MCCVVDVAEGRDLVGGRESGEIRGFVGKKVGRKNSAQLFSK